VTPEQLLSDLVWGAGLRRGAETWSLLEWSGRERKGSIGALSMGEYKGTWSTLCVGRVWSKFGGHELKELKEYEHKAGSDYIRFMERGLDSSGGA
jgi:hypothetical protein